MQIENSAQTRVNEIRNTLQKNGFTLDNTSKKEYNFEFTASLKSEKVKVLVYFGKKGIKIILQGNTATGAYKLVDELINGAALFDKNDNDTIEEPEVYIGSDESGKGDFFGPLVTAAVYVDEHSKKELQKIGVRDSKELVDSQIDILAVKIKRILDGSFEVIFISPEKYNELYTKFNNVNKLLNWAHSKAIENLLEKYGAEIVITDQFSKKELDITGKKIHNNVKFLQTPKAERFTAVAAASILARSSFNHWFKDKAAKGLNLPKGASSAVDDYAKMLVKKSGRAVLDDLAKLHFKTLQKVL